MPWGFDEYIKMLQEGKFPNYEFDSWVIQDMLVCALKKPDYTTEYVYRTKVGTAGFWSGISLYEAKKKMEKLIEKGIVKPPSAEITQTGIPTEITLTGISMNTILVIVAVIVILIIIGIFLWRR